MEDKFTSAYKEWLDNLNEPAPEGVWDSVANNLDIDDTWNNIANALDVDDVWTQIEKELPPIAELPARAPRIQRYLWPVAALMLLTLTTPLPDNTRMHNQESKQVSKSDLPLQSGLDNRESAANQAEPKQNEDHQDDPTSSDFYPSLNSISKTLVPETGSRVNSTIAAPDTAMHAVSQSHIITDNAQAAEVKTDSINIQNQEIARVDNNPADSTQGIPPPADKRTSKWQIGAVAAFKNTWLVNEKTSNGLRSGTLGQTVITYGKEVGVTVTRKLTTRTFILAEYYFFSEVGQSYDEYNNALYQRQAISLRYHKLHLLYGKSIIERPRFSTYLLGGAYASKLITGRSMLGRESGDVTPQYRPWDYGFILGIDNAFRINEHLSIVPGIRATYGVRNVFYGSDQIPANFNNTHTATIGISLGVKYQQ